MANAALETLKAQIQKTTEVEASAVKLINGIAERVQKAVEAATANGATAEELAPVQAEADSLKASADMLAGAVLANTPAATPANPTVKTSKKK